MTINEQLDNNNIDIVFTDKMNMTVTDITPTQYSSQKDLQVKDAFKFDLNTTKDGTPTLAVWVVEDGEKNITSHFSNTEDKFVEVNISKDGEITVSVNGNQFFNVNEVGLVNVSNETYTVDAQQTLDNAVMLLEAEGLNNLADLIRN